MNDEGLRELDGRVCFSEAPLELFASSARFLRPCQKIEVSIYRTISFGRSELRQQVRHCDVAIMAQASSRVKF